MAKKILPYLIIFLCLLPLIFPLVRPGFWFSDDGGWMVIRLSAFSQTLRAGQFPVRFLYSLNHGYGYPVLDFLYPLPFYIGEIIHLVGFGFVDSVKLLFAGSVLFSALGMYLYASAKWGTLSGLIAAIFYSYAPYRLFDLFNRGSLGEAVAFIFPPLIFYFLSRVFQYKNANQSLVFASLATAALILSHNVIAFLFFPLITTYLLFKIIKGKSNGNIFFSSIVFMVLSLSLSAFFWFPALYDLQFTKALQVQVSDFSSYWLTFNNYPLLIGWLIPLVLVLSLVKSLWKKDFSLLLILGVTIVSLWFSLSWSKTLWELTSLPKLVQFPWRFLSVTIFGTSLLAAYLFSGLKVTRYLLVLTAITIGGTLWLALSSVHTTQVFLPEGYYTTNDDTTTVKNEYMPKWVASDPTSKPLQKVEISPTGQSVQINTVYFPGWKAYVNGQEVNIDYVTNGLIRVKINSSQDKVSTQFTETPERTIADCVSLFGLVLTVLLLWRKRFPMFRTKVPGYAFQKKN